jgi:hypothetical protein
MDAGHVLLVVVYLPQCYVQECTRLIFGRLAVTNQSENGKIIPERARSSAAERTAHNRLVVGSNPTGPIFVRLPP